MGGATVSTAGVTRGEAFEFWEAALAAALVPCAIEPADDAPFYGWLRQVAHTPSISVSVGATAAKHGWRSRQHVDAVSVPTVVATINVKGRGVVASGDTVLEAEQGSMFLFDSTTITDLHTTDYEIVLGQISRDQLVTRSRIPSSRFPAVAVIPPVGPGALMIRYFQQLVGLPPTELSASSTLDTAVDLLAAALATQAGQRPEDAALRAMEWQRIQWFLRAHLTDPTLTIDSIARDCLVSRRTLFRLAGNVEGGPMAVLRRLRIQRACEILVSRPDLAVASVALECGFTGERHFHRAFRRETGTTPAAYRQARCAQHSDAQPATPHPGRCTGRM